MQYKPYPYQDHAEQHIIDNSYGGLLMEMGLGKTVCTLTAIDKLMNDFLEINKVLIIAPKRVAEDTWPMEVKKWDHLKHLRISVVLGTERQRKEALLTKADIYVINRENVTWLISHYQSKFPFDMLVIDELSSFKSAKAARFKALRTVRPSIKRVIGLTGTPMPNGLLDLWPQMYLLDQGERLGKSLTGYRERYFTPGKRNGHVVYNYKPKNETASEVFAKISDICISMKTKDYLDLPQRIERTISINLGNEKLQQYLEFEKKQILAIVDKEDISVVNAAALNNKLMQFASGAVYDAEKNVHEVHTAKIEALEEILEASLGKPVLVFYWFKHSLSRIKKYLSKYNPEELGGTDHIKKWNEGKVPFMLAHPASAGHGLNMQDGGHIAVWFELPNWSCELYQQGNGRLDRQGQLMPPRIFRLIVEGTMDIDMLQTIDGKGNEQDGLMNAVKARIQKYRA